MECTEREASGRISFLVSQIDKKWRRKWKNINYFGIFSEQLLKGHPYLRGTKSRRAKCFFQQDNVGPRRPLYGNFFFMTIIFHCSVGPIKPRIWTWLRTRGDSSQKSITKLLICYGDKRIIGEKYWRYGKTKS